ncbi:MAG TPA: DUF397 domain-containing protein [Pseudonocardiaceae bacterium]|jgi:hypothetical protein|nr:DUF397 domain-containing protein [Pseudonocardiaceae bacterium]
MSSDRWRKSSYSNPNGNCVELARTLDQMRDSKNPAGPVLHIGLTELLTGVKNGQFTR